MFPKALFTHKYDIDDIILALCASGPQWLNTNTGEITAAQPQVEESRAYPITPLPSTFITDLAASDETRHLNADEQAQLQALLAAATVQQLPQHFAEGRTGGWLRERVKDAALEWLDSHDLIPPSMRHINRQKAAKLYASARINIVDDEPLN